MNGLRLAVTGASGFCGGAVARLAADQGAEVLCLGRRPGPVGTFRYWDATHGPPDLSGVDAVICLAAAVGDPARTRESERAFHRVNVEATARLLAVAAGRPVVWVSSGSVYAPGPLRDIDEGSAMTGQLNTYGRTKAAGDRLACAAGAVVLRPRAVYGPGDRHLLPALVRLVRGRLLLLPGPDIWLSLTAVENLAGACLAALRWEPGPYNIADSTPYRRDAALCATLSAATGRELVVRRLPPAPLTAVATVLERLARRGSPMLSRYSLDLLTSERTYDLTRARAQGYRPGAVLGEHVTWLGRDGRAGARRPPHGPSRAPAAG